MTEETTETTALVPSNGTLPARDPRAGVGALAEMNQGEFEARLNGLRAGRDRLARIHRELLVEGVDYGVIPGTPKPTLLKPGAEKIGSFYSLAATFRPVITYGDGVSSPDITIVTECCLHLGTTDGAVVNTGFGAANNWERKHRRGEPFDLMNTLLKMSEKRSFVCAILRATATSGLYSQDLEDHQEKNPQPQTRCSPTGKVARPMTPRDAGQSAPQPTLTAEPVVCAEEGCGIILDANEIKAASLYREAFHDEVFCTAHGKVMLEIFRAAPAEADPFVNA